MLLPPSTLASIRAAYFLAGAEERTYWFSAGSRVERKTAGPFTCSIATTWCHRQGADDVLGERQHDLIAVELQR